MVILILTGINLKENLEGAIRQSGLAMDKMTNQLCDNMTKYLMTSKSDNTTKKYFAYFQKWKSFVAELGHSSLPAHPVHIALYLTSLLDKGASFSILSSTKYALKFVHEINGLTDPTNNAFVNNLVEASKRQINKRVNKKEPVTVEHLKTLCNLYSDTTELDVVRDLAMILLSFSGFLRFDELISLKCNDIVFHSDHMSISIRKSKTDQYRLGNQVVISKGESEACPYSMLQRYFKIANLNGLSESFIFRPINKSRNSCKLIDKNRSLSYTRSRECIVSRLKTVVGDLNIGLHSLRAGGATAAANANVNDRCWKRHGRWRSDSAKDGYVKDSLSNRLSVTKMLNM